MKRFLTALSLVAVAALPVGAPAQTTPGQPKPEPGKPREIRPIENARDLGLWKGSQIIGQNVDDTNGKRAGKIEDLMIDRNGDVVYAILSFGGFLGIGDKLFAVPWSAMKFNHENGKVKSVVLDVSKERLEKAPAIARERWSGDWNRQWGTEADRYWGDSSITAKVKAKLASDRMKTLTQVNVDTNQGTVRLSGTVDRQDQKQRAADLARQVKGVRKVDNELQVKAGG